MTDEQSTAPDTQAIQAELEALRRKNAELLDDYKKAVAQAKAIPDGVNVDELLEFKRHAEQTALESQGKYSEARQVFGAAVP
jgi:hypothetical protein